jgi:endonuclease YncB( thermonuclease family)
MSRKPTEFENHPMSFPERPVYRAFCRHVVDGDTLDVLVDMGLNQFSYETIRLQHVDTPEIFRPGSESERLRGLEAKALVESLILNRPVRIITARDAQTFGRFVGEVWFHDGTGWQSVGEILKARGLVKQPDE